MTTGKWGTTLAALVLTFLGLGTGPVRPSVAVAATNACGCYGDSATGCYCNKNAKCGCPGECEPKGCEAQRQKQFDREIQIETRKAAETARKRGGKAAADPAEPEAAAPSAAGRAKRERGEMTGSQKRELSRLLNLYLAERPGDRSKNASDLLSDLSHAEKTADKSDSKSP
jgi:hypothetical protein